MTNMLLAGFGGQGVLFAGKIIAYAGLMEDRQVSWLPSYGPEMRGGTANCSVCLSDQPIGSPLVLNPELLIVMNLPSYDKFIGTVTPGGIAVIDSALSDVPILAVSMSLRQRWPASRIWKDYLISSFWERRWRKASSHR